MKISPSDIVFWCYLTKLNEDGTYFCKLQFDTQFKGILQDVKDEMLVVKLHTEKGSNGTKIRYQEHTVNLHGTFSNSFGKELERLMLERIKNKPKSYR